MTVRYEWDIESLDSDGEILDHSHAERLADLPHVGIGQELVLIRDVGDDARGLTERAWAYVKGGRLPSHFSDASGANVAPVPGRFHRELAIRGA